MPEMIRNIHKPSLRIGMVGYSFMGAIHSHAWRTAPRFFDLPVNVELAAIAGRDRAKTTAAAETMGWESVESDWRQLIARDDIDVIDICSPGDTHRDIAIAALAANKHVLCEKPLANSVEEAEEMAQAARDAAQRGIFAMCGYTYRRTPAVTLAKQLVDEGRIGAIRHVRGQYLQDWLSDADAPMTWRLDKTTSGSGALGDIGAHIIDAAQFVTGLPIEGVSAMLNTFVTSRPIAGELVGLGGSGDIGGDYGHVTVDDAALLTARFAKGAIGIFEATRFALGRKNAIRLEINGTRGSIFFDFEDMNVLNLYDGSLPHHTQGFQRIQVTEPEHPYIDSWWPVGHGLGYEHGFTHQAVDFVRSIRAGTQPSPSFDDALNVQRVLDAVERSAESNSQFVRTGTNDSPESN